jgi:hypothetical protein
MLSKWWIMFGYMHSPILAWKIVHSNEPKDQAYVALVTKATKSIRKQSKLSGKWNP